MYNLCTGVPSQSDGYSGYGYTIWNRITEAASNLTVNVNMAWAANIVSHSGEGMNTPDPRFMLKLTV